MKCVKNITVYDKECLNKCDGLFITGIERREFDQEKVDKILAKVEDDYERYKTGANLQLPGESKIENILIIAIAL